jgi:hypothetical protein
MTFKGFKPTIDCAQSFIKLSRAICVSAIAVAITACQTTSLSEPRGKTITLAVDTNVRPHPCSARSLTKEKKGLPWKQ